MQRSFQLIFLSFDESAPGNDICHFYAGGSSYGLSVFPACRSTQLRNCRNDGHGLTLIRKIRMRRHSGAVKKQVLKHDEGSSFQRGNIDIAEDHPDASFFGFRSKLHGAFGNDSSVRSIRIHEMQLSLQFIFLSGFKIPIRNRIHDLCLCGSADLLAHAV